MLHVRLLYRESLCQRFPDLKDANPGVGGWGWEGAKSCREVACCRNVRPWNGGGGMEAREGGQDVRVELNDLECVQEHPRKFCADVFS